MKTPKEFDYDLFKDEAGIPHIRVKRTGEVCEVNDATFRLLRNEAMAMYRKQQSAMPSDGQPTAKVVVEQKTTITIYPCEMDEERNPERLIAPTDVEGEVINKLMFAEFYRSLTDKQREVFTECLMNGVSGLEFARLKERDVSCVYETIRGIQKKYKKIF